MAAVRWSGMETLKDFYDDDNADENLARHHAVVVGLYPEDAGEQREGEQHAHPHDVMQLSTKVHDVELVLLENAGRVFYAGPPKSPSGGRPLPAAGACRPKGGRPSCPHLV